MLDFLVDNVKYKRTDAPYNMSLPVDIYFTQMKQKFKDSALSGKETVTYTKHRKYDVGVGAWITGDNVAKAKEQNCDFVVFLKLFLQGN